MLLTDEMSFVSTTPMDAWDSGIGFTIKCVIILAIILIIGTWKLSK